MFLGFVGRTSLLVHGLRADYPEFYILCYCVSVFMQSIHTLYMVLVKLQNINYNHRQKLLGRPCYY